MTQTRDWSKAEIDCDFLVDSGLLFEMNRQMLHPVGIAAMVCKAPDGTKRLAFKDYRDAPESAVFDPGVLELGRRKFVRFMKSFGHRQMDRRSRKLGQTCQHVEPSWD